MSEPEPLDPPQPVADSRITEVMLRIKHRGPTAKPGRLGSWPVWLGIALGTAGLLATLASHFGWF